MPRHPALVPLSHDHRDALALAFFLHHPSPPGRESAMTPRSTAADRQARLLRFFDEHLRRHFRIEEEALFPRLTTRRPLVASLLADHQILTGLRDAVAGATGDQAIDEATAAFADLLETHIRREERELFAFFPEDLDAATIDAIAAGIRAGGG